MRLSRTCGLLLVLLATSGSSAGYAADAPPVAAAPPSLTVQPGWRTGRAAELLTILDEHYEWLLAGSPLTATSRGERRFNRLLPDVSPEAVTRRAAERSDRLARLNKLMASAENWSEIDRTDAELLRFELELGVAGDRFHREQLPVDRISGPQVWLPQMADSLAFATESDYDDYAARLAALPAHVDQQIAQMRLGLAAGRVPPRVTVVGTDEQAALIASADIEASPSLSSFFKPFRTRPSDDPIAKRAEETIRTGIVPAYRRLAAFLRDEYIPKSRASVGASEGIDGVAGYEHALRAYTTTTLTPDEVHQIGLREVARIRANMFKVIARSDWSERDAFAAGSDELFRAFVTYLRTNPRFYFDKADDLLAAYRDIAKKVDPALPRLFGTLPRTPYGIREMPAFAAPSSPTAYYYRGSPQLGLPGFFIANTYRLDQRPKYEMVPLTLHEACPGHHFQIAISQELNGLHPYREMVGHTAMVEGWGLYAEKLGLEMAADGSGERVARPTEPDGPGTGLYADPYDDFGRLTYEMWRSCRLVVDTGIHAKGWTRQQAIDFMLANTALSPHNIEREVDRYIGWPGQACAYKLGELKIIELRARAERALGDRFDIRSFHDCLLLAGAVPLTVLETRVERWITAQTAN